MGMDVNVGLRVALKSKDYGSQNSLPLSQVAQNAVIATPSKAFGHHEVYRDGMRLPYTWRAARETKFPNRSGTEEAFWSIF